MANTVEPDQTAFRNSLIWVYTFCRGHLVRKFGVWQFRTFTIIINLLFMLCSVEMHVPSSSYLADCSGVLINTKENSSDVANDTVWFSFRQFWVCMSYWKLFVSI